jgi:steroid 5-alpha reductase family enzyme
MPTQFFFRGSTPRSSLQLIDLYWTVIPVMLLHYYRGHPASVADAVRSAVAVVLTWVWSARLTHNYLRREGWELGRREDWRFNEMRGQYGKTWWWMSFFAVYLSQQVASPFRKFCNVLSEEMTIWLSALIHSAIVDSILL